MAKKSLPKLTEAQVRKLASAQSFERGERYYRDGAIIDPVQQDLELRAQCEGSEYEPYEVSATLAKDGVAEVDCSCSYDFGGACKHIVALLLTYVYDPGSFRAIEPVGKILGERSKEELIELIGEMVKRDPKVLGAVEMAAALPKKGAKKGAEGETKPGKPMNVSAYRGQARRAMRSESPRVMERELKALRDAAARLAKTGDWLNAGAIYHAALDEAVLGYDDLVHSMDEDGDICVVMDELAEGLGKCLGKGVADADTRWAWVETMLEAELKDIEIGGVDLAPSAGEAVLKLANDEEWARVEDHLRTEAAGSRDWRRETLIGFLSEGLERRKRADEADELVRELGTPEQQTYLLISEGKIGEALKLIKKIVVSKPGLVTPFADALVGAKAKKEALALVTEHGGGDHWSTRDWLAKYYRQHGTLQEAVEAQQGVFLNSPSVESFKTLREVSQKAKNWDEVRAGVLDELEGKKRFDALIEIALYEGDVARALERLPLVKGGWHDYKSEVAQAAEKDHPEAAIAIYQEMAERTIENRHRSSYQQAVAHLKRAKKLYGRLGTEGAWAAYLQALRARYPTLRAFQEELQKARL